MRLFRFEINIMKKVISFSLWGNNPKYCIGAIKNAYLKNYYYPDWICKFYIHKDVSNEYISILKDIKNIEISIISDNYDWSLSLERFKAIDDLDVSHVIFRDTDSRLNQREADAVNEWIKQDTCIHIMKDHPYHGNFPILAGMWGLNKNKFIYKMSDLIKIYEDKNITPQYYYDQYFLQNYIWPNLKNSSTIHDEIFLNKPYPTKRFANEFVGQSFDENDNTPIEHIEALNIL